MSLQTNLKGRLRNTKLPKSHALMPVFEAIVNSIHSIEDSFDDIQKGKITLEIVRSSQANLSEDFGSLPPIIGFKIFDNGCGFNKSNFESFQLLDTEHKIGKGCRGIGRLLWLKVFQQAHITSTFIEEDKKYSRNFTFSELGVDPIKSIPVDAGDEVVNTCVYLENIFDEYLKSIPVTLEKIAMSLLEHCVWYFVRQEGCPDIIVKDRYTTQDLNELYDKHITLIARHDSFTINDFDFQLTHIKFRESRVNKHQLAYCAAGRLVKEENLDNKITGLFGALNDSGGEFFYTCYITSKYLDDRVRPERTSFDIAEKTNDILDNTEVTLSDIRNNSIEKSENFLSSYLEKNKIEALSHTKNFINSKAPRYKPLIKYFPESELIIDPNIQDKELKKKLHSMWYDVEQQILEESYKYLSNESVNIENYEGKLASYLNKVADLKSSDLASYVLHRKVVLDILEKAIGHNEQEKYYNENVIHELIMPMGRTSEQVRFDKQNLWLIDERLAFHNYLASDKTIRSMTISNSQSRKEPDILSLKEWNSPFLVNDKVNPPLASITVIELKKPMRNDMKDSEDKDPIQQCLGYLNRIRKGEVKTSNGLSIPAPNDNIPGYCYILADLTPTMIERCNMATLKKTSDGMGYFGYNDNYKAYIEVISYNQLLLSAKERNRAFFDKLGLASN